ncbi:Imm30 family immunity protein [Bacillus toyonensis]|uniref:Imm30 family immunity protein n=1 Tax=Bacillus toyonensis TaxID=155322 RepID=UPI0021D03A6B|nr:Imm30 family immunity protein [Bacillus toyonensis]MCU4766528.1 Imm30 family immunity protein [Bacillus toyonensis]
MDSKSEIKRLYSCRFLKNQSECEEFDSVLENLADCDDEKLIKELCIVFEDETQEVEVMFGLVHFIEDFEMEKYLTEMPKALPKMVENAKEWAMLLNIRILNNDLYRSEYAKILVGMNNDIKLTVINLLNEIISDDPKRFEGVANEILSELKEVDRK